MVLTDLCMILTDLLKNVDLVVPCSPQKQLKRDLSRNDVVFKVNSQLNKFYAHASGVRVVYCSVT